MTCGMQKRTINNVITRKVDDWLASIDDEDLRKLCKNDVIVTGGCIASMLLGEEVNDFDLYFKNYKTCVKVANYYLKKFMAGRTGEQGGIGYGITVQEMKDTLDRERVRYVVKSAGVAGDHQTQNYEYFEQSDQNDEGEAGDYVQEAFGEVSEEVRPEKPPYHPVFLSSNAITLKGGVQLIIRFFGDHEAIHENFDYVHCMNYWTRDEGVVLNMASMEALMSKTLVYKGSLYPVCSVFRAKKFIERGWKINAGQYLKMAMQINELDLKNIIVLEEQLTGVDQAYFHEVISAVKGDDETKMEVDHMYLVEIIERMFG